MRPSTHIAISLGVLLWLGAFARLDAQTDGATAPSYGPTEEGFVHVQLGSVFSQDLVVQFAGDSLLLPFTTMASVFNIVHSVSENGDTVRGEIPIGNPFVAVVSASTLTRKGETEHLVPGTIRRINDEVFVEVQTFSRMTGVLMGFDYDRLRLTISADERIPAIDRVRNRERYAALEAANHFRESSADRVETPLMRVALGSVVADWTLASSSRDGVIGHTGSFALTGPFMFGTMTMRGGATLRRNTEGRQNLTASIQNYNWSYAMPEFSPLTQVSLGFSPGQNIGALSLSLMNSPLSGRSISTIERTISGSLEPGWDVELYDGQRMIDARHSDIDGSYDFVVPMYGANQTRRLVFRGPHGEEVVEERLLRVGAGMLNPGEVRYALNGLAYGISDTVPMFIQGRMQAGIFDRLTVGASSMLRSMRMGEISPDSATLSLDANIDVGDNTPISLHVDPRSGVFGVVTSFSPMIGSVINVGADSIDVMRGTFNASMRTGMTVGPLNIAGGGRYFNLTGRHGFEISPIVYVRLFGANLGMTGRLLREYQDGFGERRDTVYTRATGRAQLSFAPISRVMMRVATAYDFEANAIDEMTAGVSVPLVGSLGLDMSYSVRGLDWKHGTFSASLAYNLPWVSASGYSLYADDHLTAGTRLSGSVKLSADGFDLGRPGYGAKSALIVRGFHDANNNGEWDGGEEGLGGVNGDLFNQLMTQMGRGSQFESIPPYQNCLLMIESHQLADSGLYPRRSQYRFSMPPGSIEVLDIPFSRGRDVVARVEIVFPELDNRKGKPTIMLGSKAKLVAVDGSAEYEGEFFQDGNCIFYGVAPGEYRIALKETELEARGLTVGFIEPTVVVDETVEELPTIVLHPIKKSTPAEADDENGENTGNGG